MSRASGRAARAGGARLADASGVALLSALLSVALLTLIVVEMTDATLVASHLNRNAGNTIAARLLARSAEAVAEGAILQTKDNEGGRVSLIDGIGVPIPDIPVGDGSAGVLIEDEQGKLDLNLVEDEDQFEFLRRLFEELDLQPAEALLTRVRSWRERGPSGEPSPKAAAECSLEVPCEPRGGDLRSLDELVLIEGFDPAMVERLRPYVTAFVGTHRPGVNVNTARPVVLRAIGCDAGDDFTAPPEGFGSPQETGLECEDDKLLQFDSKVFSIQARGSVGDTTETLFAIVARDGSRMRRLYWRERPVFAVGPIAVP